MNEAGGSWIQGQSCVTNWYTVSKERNWAKKEGNGCHALFQSLQPYCGVLLKARTSDLSVGSLFYNIFYHDYAILKNYVLKLYCNLNLYSDMQIYLTLRLLTNSNHLVKKRKKKTTPDIQSSARPSRLAHVPLWSHTYTSAQWSQQDSFSTEHGAAQVELLIPSRATLDFHPGPSHMREGKMRAWTRS